MSDMPTSPVSTPPVGAEPIVGSPLGQADTMMSEWSRVGAFLKRPKLVIRSDGASPWTVLGRVYLLDLVIMFALLTLAGILMAAGIELPRTAIADMEIGIGLAALVIIGAPVVEEFVFRGWLSGRPGWLAAIVIFGVAGIGAAFWGVSNTGETAEAGVAGIMLLAAVVAIIAAILLRKRPAMGWFKAIFPAMFWLSAIGFALVHVPNFDAELAWYAALPLVLPQLILGSLAGYVRVQVGLWAAMALHAAHNATALGIAMLAMSAG